MRNDWIDGVGPEVEREIEQRERACCAAKLGGDDATTLATAGFVLVRVAGHHDDGAAFIERALNLNVNLARAWLYSAWVRIWLGEVERAIRHHQAMRFSPLDPWLCSMQTAIAFAHFFLARDDEATFLGVGGLRDRPHFPPALRVSAASHALAGRSEGRWKSWVACDRSIPVCALPT